MSREALEVEEASFWHCLYTSASLFLLLRDRWWGGGVFISPPWSRDRHCPPAPGAAEPFVIGVADVVSTSGRLRGPEAGDVWLAATAEANQGD